MGVGEWEQMTCRENRHPSPKSTAFILLPCYGEKHVLFIFFFPLSQKWKKKFAFLILCLCKPKNILRLYSIPCSANVCIMFYCRLYFICTSEQTDGNSSGSGDSVYLCKPQILVSLAMLDISWVTTFFFLSKWMNELIILFLLSILTSLNWLLILFAFSLPTFSGDFSPVFSFCFFWLL